MKSRWYIPLLIVTIGVITSVPYIVGWAYQSQQAVFLAVTPGSPADTAAYFSQIEQARQGRWIFANQFTSEQQNPSLVQPIWLIAGWLARWFSVTTPVIFHLVRILAGAAFLVFVFSVTRRWGLVRRERVLVITLLISSSGLGWLWLRHVYEGRSILSAPVDLWVDEATTFFSLSHSALFVVAQTLTAVTMWAMYRVTALGERVGWWPGVVLLVLGVIHPYDIVPIVGVAVVWLAAWCSMDAGHGHRRSAMMRVGSWFLWVLPAIGYYYLVPWQQPAVRGWFVQNINLSPTPMAVVLGYGLLWPLAIIGAISTWRSHQRPSRLFVCWIVVVVALLYLPGFAIQRRFISGLHIPLAILAGFGGWKLLSRLRPVLQIVGALGLVVVLGLTPFLRVITDSHKTIHPEKADYPVYMSSDTIDVISWLKDHSGEEDVVLANFWLSNMTAGLAARPEVFAHTNQTVSSWAREADWKQIVNSNVSMIERQQTLSRLRVRWLLWTTDDTARTSYQPKNDPLWVQTYQRGETILFRYNDTTPTTATP